MDIFAHQIRLHEDTAPARFEAWVKEHDYAACRELPSVLAFSVQRVSTEPAAPCHYFEVISVTSGEEFRSDMRTTTFQKLAATFDTMASVVGEVSGTRIEPGYTAGPLFDPPSRTERISAHVTDEA
ncbi:RedY protein [Streptomyces sp. NPDC050439]|uniref:RedY protein n=1 Tax=unclassified Streptomyces TaxID=2593676 RepID=UPI00343EF361